MFDPDEMALVEDEEEASDTLGPCGCTDYHMADCSVVTGDYGEADDRWWEE